MSCLKGSEVESVWFSHREQVYHADLGKFSWSDDKDIWDWTELISIDIVRTWDGKDLMVIRRKGEVFSQERDRLVNLRYMLGFSIKKIHPIETDCYIARRYLGQQKWKIDGPRKRRVFKIDDDYWIWQWADEGSEDLFGKIHSTLEEELRRERTGGNIFELDVPNQQDIVPVIYQPSADAMKNFLRDVHCSPVESNGKREVEVTLVFENEQLRRHRHLNGIYERLRFCIHGRIRDIESFRILVEKGKTNGFVFTGIYSGNSPLEEDSIHGDSSRDAPPHAVRYYANQYNQPVVFINTSNHAMAHKDNNPRLWKWEYIPWMRDSAVLLRGLSRKQLDIEYSNWISMGIKSIIKFADWLSDRLP